MKVTVPIKMLSEPSKVSEIIKRDGGKGTLICITFHTKLEKPGIATLTYMALKCWNLATSARLTLIMSEIKDSSAEQCVFGTLGENHDFGG